MELETSNSYCVQNIGQINFGVTGGGAPVPALSPSNKVMERKINFIHVTQPFVFHLSATRCLHVKSVEN